MAIARGKGDNQVTLGEKKQLRQHSLMLVAESMQKDMKVNKSCGSAVQ